MAETKAPRHSVDAAPITRAHVGLRSERGPILLAVMLSVALVAIDATILATAVPSIVNDLGGFAHFPWLFSIYLLAQAVSVPIFAKFSDLVGRKPIMLIGVGLFVAGSILCGLAWSMPALIAFRALQGIGAGSVQPTAMTIIGDVYSVAERAKVQGYVASVWAMSSVVGPTLGGVFVDFLNWRWNSVPSIAILTAGAVLLIIFGFMERRAAEPILPGWVFRRRLLNTTNTAAVIIGVMLIGLTSYVPLFAQGVLGTNALVAGFALAALTLGWPLSASMAGHVYLRIGFRNTALIGATVIIIGAALMVLLATDSSIWQVGATCFVVGLGMGMTAAPTLIAAQASVDWEERGVVTGTNMFSRSMGSALGIAVFGAIANTALTSGTGGHLSSTTSGIPAAILDHALHGVFVAAAVVAVVLLLAVVLMPKTSPGIPASATRR